MKTNDDVNDKRAKSSKTVKAASPGAKRIVQKKRTSRTSNGFDGGHQRSPGNGQPAVLKPSKGSEGSSNGNGHQNGYSLMLDSDRANELLHVLAEVKNGN